MYKDGFVWYDQAMTTATNDTCTVHDLERDVHDAAPTDCPRCVPIFPMARPFACLSHTCPDCGSITHALVNERRELIHDCPDTATKEAP